MTEDDMIDLLSMASAFDSRTVGEADVAAWLAVADACGWTTATARRALVLHYGTNTHRLMPGHITAIVEAERARIRRSYLPCPPPVELRDNPAAERRWLRDRARHHVEAGLAAWIDGREVPELEPPLHGPD